MGWNTFAEDGTLDWAAVDFLNLFIEEINKRQLVTGAPALPDVAEGDDVSSVQFVRSLQETTEGMVGGATLFLRDPEGAPFGGTDPESALAYDVTGWRQAAGIDPAGFRRQRPREVTPTSAVAQDGGGYWTFTAAATDDEGNTAVEGHIAWGLSSPVRMYRYDGAKWTTEGVVRADTPEFRAAFVLDSANDPGGGSYVAPGLIEEGDYIGWWLFAEPRDGLNLLRFLRLFTSIDEQEAKELRTEPGAYTNSSSGGRVSAELYVNNNFAAQPATAEGAAAAWYTEQWAPLLPGGDGDYTSPASWHVHAFKARFKLGVDAPGDARWAPSLPKRVRFYLAPTRQSPYSATVPWPINQFDFSSYHFDEDVFTEKTSTDVAAGVDPDAVLSDWIGDLSFAPGVPLPGASSIAGTRVTRASAFYTIGVIDYGVDGAFRHAGT